MDKPKYTPGPYSVDRMSVGGNYVVTRLCPGSTKYNRAAFNDVICRLEPAYDCFENASLFAAAPELLEELEVWVSRCPCTVKERLSGHLTNCRAPLAIELIARAKGEGDKI